MWQLLDDFSIAVGLLVFVLTARQRRFKVIPETITISATLKMIYLAVGSGHFRVAPETILDIKETSSKEKLPGTG